MADLPSGLLASATGALLAWAAGALRPSGAAAGAGVASLVFAGGGWAGLGLLFVFVAAGTAATRIGWDAKAARAKPEAHGGRRGAAEVLANGGVAAACGLGNALFPDPLWLAAMAGSASAALSDTLSSEIGMLAASPPRDLLTLRPLSPGTDGGITVLGLAAGLLGAAAAAGASTIFYLTEAGAAAAIAAAGLLGNLADSALGSALERRGWISNAGVNLAATAVGAAAAAALRT